MALLLLYQSTTKSIMLRITSNFVMNLLIQTTFFFHFRWRDILNFIYRVYYGPLFETLSAQNITI